MQHLILGANTPLTHSRPQLTLRAKQRLGQQLGMLWLPLDNGRKLVTTPAYLHQEQSWATPSAQNTNEITWQLDLAPLFDRLNCQSLQLVIYEYHHPNFALPAVELDTIGIHLSPDNINYEFCTRERHVKVAVVFEIYQRHGQYKCRALAETSTQHLPEFANRLGIHLDATNPHLNTQNSPQNPRPRTGDTWTGTAFAIDRYHLLTCHHVVDGARVIGLRQEGFADLQAQVVIADEGSDTALLKVQNPLPHHLPLRELGCDLLGENVVTMGFPLASLNSQLQVTQGNIAGLRGTGDDIRFLQFTAPIQAGSSGSPLLLHTGEVVGMVTHTIANTQNMNYATKYQLLSALVSSGGLNLNDLPKTKGQNLTTPQLTKNSRQALWLVGCQA